MVGNLFIRQDVTILDKIAISGQPYGCWTTIKNSILNI